MPATEMCNVARGQDVVEVHFLLQMVLTCWSAKILWAPPLHGLT